MDTYQIAAWMTLAITDSFISRLPTLTWLFTFSFSIATQLSQMERQCVALLLFAMLVSTSFAFPMSEEKRSQFQLESNEGDKLP